MSETTNLKLFKHDNPSTNTNEFNVDTALNQNWDKIDNFVGTVNGKILEIQNKDTEQDEKISSMQSEIEVIQEKDNVQDTKLAELQAENERLRKDINGLPSGQATAETIYLTDSAEMRFKKFGIGGNSVQKIRSGKNLAYIENINQVGVEIAKLNGYIGNITIALKTKEGTSQINYRLIYEDGTQSNNYIIAKNQSNEVWYVANINVEKALSTIELYNVTAEGFIARSLIHVMVLKGQYKNITDDDYEPYGAMPSPDYPSEVESCGDNVNIFNKDTMPLTRGLWASGNVGKVVTNVSGWYVFLPITGGKTYTISKKNIVSTNTINRLGVLTTEEEPSDGVSMIDFWQEVDNDNEITINTSSNAKYLFIGLLASANPSEQDKLIAIEDLKVEKGSKSTPYSPYGQGCINEVICNKNIFNPDLVVDNTYQNINNSWNVSTYNGAWTSGLQSIKENTQYSSNYLLTTGAFYDKEKNVIKKNAIYQKNTFTTPQGAYYIDFTVFEMALGYENAKQIQIVEGTELGDYEEHKSQTYTIPTQQPFRAIGDIRDTFIKKNNKRFEKHWIFRKIFDGTENFNLLGQNFASDVLVDSIKFIDDITIVYKSNYFKAIPASERNNPSDNSIWFNGAKRLFIHSTQFSTLNEFKTYLQEQYNAGTPVYIDYILETPLDIECTPEQNEILDKIEQEAHTYKNVTHIYSTDEVEPVEDVEYIKDIETLINKATTVAE